MTIARYKDLCIDANDPVRLGRFYADVLSLDLQVDDDGDAHLIGAAPQETVWINEVPEPKSVKHRVHVDVNTRAVADVEAAGATVLDDLLHAGATLLRAQDDEIDWTVLADPEGNEFCAFVAR